METTEVTLRAPRQDEAQALGQIGFDAFASISDAHSFPRDFPSAEIPIGLMGMLLNVPFV